jgi:hypothetical protein
MAIRSRYTEDELRRAIHRGIAQYVILGADLDSLAYRARNLAPLLRVFEVDLPGSQRWKCARLRALSVAEPILVAPPLALTFLVCTIFALHRSPRVAFLGATVMEAAVSAYGRGRLVRPSVLPRAIAAPG